MISKRIFAVRKHVFYLLSMIFSKRFIQKSLQNTMDFIDYHTKVFGFSKSNVEFHLDKIEHLTDDIELKMNSFDVVVLNCVVNLSPDKKKVLQQIYEMLKHSAICENDLIIDAVEVGFTRPLLVTQQSICVNNEEL
ncbi:hypothetical protein I4U23_012722 [Adineta vaga]|nr:hypothetical protein I4U23_012722 [Adineta vaga]